MLRALVLISLASMASAAGAQPARPGPTIALGGDVLYEAPLDYQLRARAETIGREAALRELFSELAPALGGADLAIVNLEVPISARYRERDPSVDAAVFRAPEDFLAALAEAGVDAVTVANNHAFDQGVAGLRNTLRATERHGVRAIGAGDDARAAARAVTLEADGARIAIAAWTEGSNHRPRRGEGPGPRIAFLHDETMPASLAAARRDASLVIAVFHWIQEEMIRPRAMMREAAIQAAEAGADLVVGHGTHLPGSTEVVHTSDGRAVHVLYSLGNLVAAMHEPAGRLDSRRVGVRDAPLARVHTRWVGRRLEVSEVEVLHHWIAAPTGEAPWLPGGRLHVLRPMRIEGVLARIAAADCGAPCAHDAREYGRRIALIDAAMARLDDGPVTGARIASAGPRTTAATLTAHTEAARIARAPSVETAPRDTSADLAGVVLPITFRPHAARESDVDAAAITRLVERLQRDRALRVEVIGYATEEEHASRSGLGALRARRVMGLIAGRGPSRARFTTRGGEPGGGPRPGTAHVVVRVR